MKKPDKKKAIESGNGSRKGRTAKPKRVSYHRPPAIKNSQR